MPKDNDNIDVPWTGLAPWDSTDSNTRLPTPEEIAAGFPCGPADQALFNFTVTYAWGQIYNAMLEAGVTPDLTDLTQLSDIMLIAQNNLSDINDAPTARSNLGLGNVDDTSDLDKPVSNDTQDALNLKANIDSPVLTGTPEAPTATVGTNTTQIATTAFVRQTLDASPLSGFRNKIINGDFEISQRGTSFSSPGYSLDRWMFLASGAGTGRVGTVNQYIDETVAAQIGSTAPQHLNWTETTAGSGYTFKAIEQRIENVRTLGGKKVTVTFWAVMPTGGPHNLSLTLRQVFGTSGSPSAPVDTTQTVIIPGDSTWRKYSVAIQLPSISGKTLTPGNYLSLLLHMPFDKAFAFSLKRVSLVEGDATGEGDPFASRHVQQELALCQRYYEKSLITAYLTTPTTVVRCGVQFKVEKRFTPAVQLINPSPDTITPASLIVPTIATDGFRVNSSTAAADSGVWFGWSADAEL